MPVVLSVRCEGFDNLDLVSSTAVERPFGPSPAHRTQAVG